MVESLAESQFGMFYAWFGSSMSDFSTAIVGIAIWIALAYGITSLFVTTSSMSILWCSLLGLLFSSMIIQVLIDLVG